MEDKPVPLWEKKANVSPPEKPVAAPPEPPRLEKPMMETTPRPMPAASTGSQQTILGRSVVVKGELSGNEDLQLDGQFEGTINVQDHCLTVGPQGQVKSEIHARQVVIHGSVNGKITARDKIDIRKTGNVVGDLISSGVAIEDGAYFKGSIEIQRNPKAEAPRAHAASVD
jgi:cytoskeletal protein CcmA (bactofilin family)